jgi:hypothetical protein
MVFLWVLNYIPYKWNGCGIIQCFSLVGLFGSENWNIHSKDMTYLIFYIINHSYIKKPYFYEVNKVFDFISIKWNSAIINVSEYIDQLWPSKAKIIF